MTDAITNPTPVANKVDPVKLAARLVAEKTKLQDRLVQIAIELEPLAAIAAAAEEAAKAREVIDVTGLDAYTKVTFEFGRKDNRKTLSGEVVAFAPAADKLPARYKIEVGSGFEASFYVVPSRDVALAAPVVVADALAAE